MKNLIIITGGSGGHVIPSISLFEHLKKKFDIKIITDLRGSKFINKNKYDYKIIDIPNLFLKPYLIPINIIRYIISIFKSYSYLKKNKIDIVISTGGYMSFPLCFVAYLLDKKIFLFEPNSVLGRSNKYSLKFSNKIICYDENLKKFPKKYNLKKVLIKPILKKEIYEIKKNSKNSEKRIKKILIIGGSQGAAFFDNTITDLIIKISKSHELEIIQQISNKNNILLNREKYSTAKINFEFFNFTNESDKIYEDIDLAVTRGGASTLSELSHLNIPFIAIPLPSARDNHQFYNSNYFYQKNCCWIFDQNKFDKESFINLVLEILKNNEDYIKKINQLEKLTNKNTWNAINKHIIEIINEN